MLSSTAKLKISEREVRYSAVARTLNTDTISPKCVCFAVMQETGGNGVGRLFEATGAATMINNCFSLLRYVRMTFVSITAIHIPPPPPAMIYSPAMILLFRKGGKVGLIGLPKVL